MTLIGRFKAYIFEGIVANLHEGSEASQILEMARFLPNFLDQLPPLTVKGLQYWWAACCAL